MENKKFEQLIDLIINEDEEQAKELFHDIVVAKSKEIYESIMEDEMKDSDDLEEGMGGQVGDLADEIQAEESGIAEDEEEIDIDFKMVVPPEFLYHGTVQKYVDSIMETGLSKQSRNYLHLSRDVETATNVGSRRGSPVILKIHALDMHKDGHVFYISKNGVYLIELVPSNYITIMYSTFDKSV